MRLDHPVGRGQAGGDLLCERISRKSALGTRFWTLIGGRDIRPGRDRPRPIGSATNGCPQYSFTNPSSARTAEREEPPA